jgi:hypothetical protein
MSLRSSVFVVISTVSIVSMGVGCVAETAEDDENPSADAADLTSRALRLSAHGTSTFTWRVTNAGPYSLSVDCRPPADPDAVGPTFDVTAPTLPGLDALQGARSPRAGAWSWGGSVPAGQHVITFKNLGAAASCTVRSAPAPQAATCASFAAWRSANINHTHVRVGANASSDWEALPASGNHWGAWAPWGVDYAKPVLKGYLLHNLEHGGVVFSYKCARATDSAACREAHDKLVSAANALGIRRFVITPDPTQPSMFAVRTWRYAYSASCFDASSLESFARAHVRHGREDEDANPPIPFDPSTTNVPCDDLMAAPDSCH